MIDIDFKNLRRIPEGNRDAFEELVCQIIERFVHLPPQSPHHVPTGSSFHRFEGAGGDGGVECIWQLPSGKKRGYQAKLFTKFSSSEKQQMAKSIKSAISNHPEIDQYTFLFPINLTGPTGKTKSPSKKNNNYQGGSSTEKMTQWSEEWSKFSLINNQPMKIYWLGKTSIVNLLLSLDQTDELRSYWFPGTHMDNTNETIIGTMSSPHLLLPIQQGVNHSRFTYVARRTNLYGRSNELSTLRSFIDSSAKFSWMCVVGAGGKGKSRLALEFCLSLDESWDSGFLHDLKGIDWNRWQPLKQTLLIVDYAAQSVADLNKLAFSLAIRFDLKKSIRLLLLERDSRDDWKNGFLSYGTRRTAILSCCYSDDMVLSGLSDTDLWSLIQESFLIEGRVSPDAPQEIIADVLRIDAQRRPLFALLAADALIAGRHIRSWDREALLTDVLQRDMQAFWMPAGVSRADYNLLVLSTLCGGFDVKVLYEIQGAIEIPSASEYDPAKLTAMTGDLAYDTIPALAPDILGSFFVLTHLMPKHGADSRARIFRDVAWKLNSKGTSAFMARTLMDFPDHPCTVPLLDGITPNGKEEARNWAILTAYKAYWELKRDQNDKAYNITEELRKFSANTDDEDIVGAFTMAVLAQTTDAIQKRSYQSATYWADYAVNMATTLPRSGVLIQCVSVILGLTMQLVAAVEGKEAVSFYLDKLDDMFFEDGVFHEPTETIGFLTIAAVVPITSNDRKWCQRAFTYYEQNRSIILSDLEASRQMSILLSLILTGAVQHDNGMMAERVIKILKDDLSASFDPVISSYFCMCVGHLMMKTPTGMTQARLSVLRNKVVSFLKREDALDALSTLFSSKEIAIAFKAQIENGVQFQPHQMENGLNIFNTANDNLQN